MSSPPRGSVLLLLLQTLSLIKQSKNNESLNFVAHTTQQHNVAVRSFRPVDLVLRVTLHFHNFIILYMQGIPYRWSGRGRVPWRRPRMAYKVASWKKFTIGTGGRSLDMQPFPCWVLPEKVPVEVWWPLIFFLHFGFINVFFSFEHFQAI